MRKLVFILIAFIAVATFIRAFDKPGDLKAGMVSGIPEAPAINFNTNH